MSDQLVTGMLPGLVLWSVRRVDLTGRLLAETTAYDQVHARSMFQLECARVGIGDGAAVYLLRDGRTVDQVVAPVLELNEAEPEVEDDDA